MLQVRQSCSLLPELFHSDLLNLFRAISHTTTLEVGRFSSVARSPNACPMEQEGSSPPGRQEVHEPLRNRDVARDPRSNLRGVVSQLALCLDTV